MTATDPGIEDGLGVSFASSDGIWDWAADGALRVRGWVEKRVWQLVEIL